MSRGISEVVKQELASDDLRLAYLVTVNFSTPLYLTDYNVPITSGNRVFTPNANIIGFDSVLETTDIRVNSFKLIMSAVDRVFVDLAMTEDYLSTEVTIDRAVMSDADQVIDTPLQIFEGNIQSFEIEDTETESQIAFDIASHWADFQKKNGRRTNANSQKRFFSNDTSFDFTSKTTQDMKWGRR